MEKSSDWHNVTSHPTKLIQYNKQVSQMRAPLAACREPAGDHNIPLKIPYDFEHKT